MRSRHVLIGVLATIFLGSGSVCAEPTWIPLGPGNPGDPVSIDLLLATPDEVVLEIRIPGFFAEETATAHGSFTRIRIPGCGRTARIGNALLPILRKAIEVPQGSAPQIEILEQTTSRYDLRGLGMPPRVFPVQAPVEKMPGARESAPFSLSMDFYASHSSYPKDLARVTETGQIRAHRFAMLQFAPVIYVPAQGTIEATERMVVRITNPGADLMRTRQVLDRYASPEFDEIASRVLLNRRAGSAKAVPPLPAGYLIITNAGFYDEMQPLAQWKNGKGYQATVTRTSDIPGGATTAAIRDYIQDAYDNWDIPPAFVLLVGDVADIPNWTGTTSSNPPTDLYYSTLAGEDFVPDLGIGRFSVATSAQAAALVQKTIDYEKLLIASGTAWLKKAVFMASEDNYTVSEGTHDYCITNYMDPAGFTSDKLYCHTCDATTQQVRDAFNNGRVLGIYSGHGGTTSWVDGPAFSQSDVNALTNLDLYPFVQSYACYTGNYTLSECFAETWIRGSGNGSLAFWASSVTSYWDEDDVLEKGVFRALFEDGVTWIAGMTNQGKWSVYEHYSGGGSTQRYYEMYNLMGDPSLDVWTDYPTSMAVTHPGTCPVGAGSYTVHVEDGRGPLADALVCLNMQGDVYRTAYTDAYGDAGLVLDPPPLETGTMDLTVTCHNFAPALETVEVVIPSIVSVVPDTVQVQTATAVTVTVQDTLFQPIANVVVTIDGWGLDPALVDTTDKAGQAVITVDAPYGEILAVVGREIGESHDCFERSIAVAGASTLPNPRVEARVDELGLLGAVAPYYEGTITGRASHAGLARVSHQESAAATKPGEECGLDLFAVGCGVDAFVSSTADTAVVRVTPVSLGAITVAITCPGFGIYTEEVPVIDVYGLLSGTVRDSSTADPLPGVPVAVFTAGADTALVPPFFEATTDAGGGYASPDSISAGPYDVYASNFGYLDFVGNTTVYWGVNTYDIDMTPAPSGMVSGTVTEEGTGRPITATVRIYRSDDMSLHSQTTSDSLAAGAYSTAQLPYFTYLFRVSAAHFMTQNVYIAVDEAAEAMSFQMLPTQGNLLVIDDDTGDKTTEPKRGPKRRMIPCDGRDAGESEKEKAAAMIAQDLLNFGYDVTTETSASTDPTTWLNYDAVIWSSGDDTAPVSVSTYRSGLNAYVASHGKLLIEGGEVGYDAASYPGYPNFADSTLHVADWEHDSSGNLTLDNPAHPMAATPNLLPAALPMSYDNYGDQDALIPDAETGILYGWSSYAGQGGVLVYDDNPDPQSSQVVFFSFDYGNVTDTQGRKDLLENAIAHLLAPESTPEGSIRGRVRLFDETSHEGVIVRTYPMGLADTTDSAGNYRIDGFHNGTYLVTASKTGFADSTVSIQIIDGGTLENIDFMLFPVFEYMDSPEIAIPDNNPAGIRVYIDVPDDLGIVSVACYVDLSHSFRGDLLVELTSPQGTTVRLHDRTGGSLDDIVTWYDFETPCDGPGSMGDLVGESALGQWELYVSDQASYDTGTLHTWGLRISAPQMSAVEEETARGIPGTCFLAQNYPNPFNPLTHIRFGLPKAGRAEISIFNIKGQRVAVLASGHFEAGIHTVAWDGTDGRDHAVASGIYFCKFEGEDYEAVNRMVLLK